MRPDPSITPDLVASLSGRIATLAIVRPHKRNAISCAMWRAIADAFRHWAGDAEVRSIVVAGSNGHFSAGADIGEFESVYADRESGAAYAALIAAAMAAVADSPKPTIAAIDGVCVGAGLGLALCCDVRVATTRARFAITPAKLGLAYSFEDTRRLVAVAGPASARDLLLSARIVDAPEALRMRLVDRIVEPEALATEVDAFARQMASRSSTSARIAKHFVALAVAGQTAEDAVTHAEYLDALEGPDFAEGRAAFLAGREPLF